MAELIIQPWDKEYWSKGARKRLYDEYQTNAMDRRLAEAEGMEGMNRASTEMTDVRRHGFDLAKMAQAYTNRLGEMGVGYEQEKDLTERRLQAQAAENLRSHAATRGNLEYQLNKDQRDAMGAFTAEAKNALKADNPNMPTADIEMQAPLLAEDLYKKYQAGELMRKAAFNQKAINQPELMFGGMSPLIRQEESADERALKHSIMERYGLGGQPAAAAPAPGSRFPSSSVPAGPGLQSGPRVLQWPPPKPKTTQELLFEKYGGASR